MSDFIKQQGQAFLAHLLRRLSDELIQGAKEWYPSVGVTAPPRTISTMLALDEHGSLGVTQLAGLLRQSHSLVIVWIRELCNLSLVDTWADPDDGRRTLVVLTSRGLKEVQNLRQALVTMQQASSEVLGPNDQALWQALWQVESSLRDKPFLSRLQELGRKESA
ncbi:MAG: MarR family transcriptional regulator [Alphaproteobacteria bacterium]|nr:MAG: MarR family transcriptional regulator [Alphaproteobacteria bacterium]